MKHFLPLIFSFYIIGCSTSENITKENSHASLISKNDIKANLTFLASDELEGREATTRGADLAALYLSTELSKTGIKPGGDNGTYFENFKLISSYLDSNSTLTFFSGN